MAVDSSKIPILSSLHRTEQTPFPQPLLIHPVLQPLAQLTGLCWTALSVERVYLPQISTSTREPQTGHSVQMWYPRCQTEGKDPFSGTAHYTLAHAAHGGSLLMQGHTEDHAQLVEYMDVQAFSFRSTFQPVCLQPVLVNAGILPIPSPVQNLTFVHDVIFMRFPSAHLSELAGSLWIPAWSSTTSTTPHSWLASTNLLKICFEISENKLQKTSSARESKAKSFENHASSNLDWTQAAHEVNVKASSQETY